MTSFLLTTVQFDPLNDFSYGELHISLKPRNVKICKHSIFSKIFLMGD